METRCAHRQPRRFRTRVHQESSIRARKHVGGGIGKITNAKHHINLRPDFCSTFQHPYLAGLKTRKQEDEETHQMVKDDVTETVVLEWANPAVFALKKDEKSVFLSTMRRFTHCPHEVQTRCHGWTSALTLWGMQPIALQLTATVGTGRCRYLKRIVVSLFFSSHHRLFQFIRMPFGLKNGPASL